MNAILMNWLRKRRHHWQFVRNQYADSCGNCHHFHILYIILHSCGNCCLYSLDSTVTSIVFKICGNIWVLSCRVVYCVEKYIVNSYATLKLKFNMKWIKWSWLFAVFCHTSLNSCQTCIYILSQNHHRHTHFTCDQRWFYAIYIYEGDPKWNWFRMISFAKKRGVIFETRLIYTVCHYHHLFRCLSNSI